VYVCAHELRHLWTPVSETNGAAAPCRWRTARAGSSPRLIRKHSLFIQSESTGAGYNPEPEGSWISSKLWKTGLQFSGSNSTKFNARFKRWREPKLRRAGSSGTPQRLSGSSGWHNRKFGLRSASGSDAPRPCHHPAPPPRHPPVPPPRHPPVPPPRHHPDRLPLRHPCRASTPAPRQNQPGCSSGMAGVFPFVGIHSCLLLRKT
jgi:hypothetical protein